MNYDEIKKLIDDMGNSKIDELNIEFPEGIKISMKKDKQIVAQNTNLPVNAEKPQDIALPVISKEKKEVAIEEEANIVKSPMVGTFYSKSAPTASPYVEVGSKVKKGDILCIIEAMKLMNEIESEYDGEVVEICVKDGDMVDFGKPLFKIK